jgi:hypothetical protein
MHSIIGLLCVPVFVVCSACTPLVGSRLVIDPVLTHRIPPFAVSAAKPGAAYERFIVIGDMGTGRVDQRKVAAAMAQRAGSDGLDFLLTTGDNFYPKGVSSADDPQWKNKFEDVYADPALQVPIYPSLGNHDHYGNPQAQIDYARHNKNWKIGGLYYTFTRTLADGTEVRFFVIDSDPIHKSDENAGAQLEWLDGQLNASDARWKIVFGHHPLYGHNPRRGHDATMIAALEPLFVKHGIDIYFAGHDHALEMIKPIKGVHHVISGAGGGPDWAYSVEWTDESYYAATLGGFVLCRISKDELVVEFVRLDARTQYAHTLTKSPLP